LLATIKAFTEINRAVEVFIAATIRNLDTFRALLLACGKFKDSHWMYRRLTLLKEAARFTIKLINYSGPGDEGPFYRKALASPILILKLQAASRPTSFNDPDCPLTSPM